MNAQHTLSMQTVASTKLDTNPHLECVTTYLYTTHMPMRVTNATKLSSLRILHDMHSLAQIFRASKY